MSEQLEKLQRQFDRYKEKGTIKETGGNWQFETKEYRTKEGRKDKIRFLLYPDGDICKEFSIYNKLDLEDVPGWKYPKDTRPMCPKDTYGERSAIREYASSLYEGLEDPADIDPLDKELFKNLMPRKNWVFRVLWRGYEDGGPKYFVTKDKDDYEYILEKILDPKFKKKGGFIGDNALDFEATGKPNAGGFKMNSFEPDMDPSPLLPDDCAITSDDLATMNVTPEEIFKRIDYNESVQILDKFMTRFFHERGIEKPEIGSGVEHDDKSELDKKFESVKGADS